MQRVLSGQENIPRHTERVLCVGRQFAPTRYLRDWDYILVVPRVCKVYSIL